MQNLLRKSVMWIRGSPLDPIACNHGQLIMGLEQTLTSAFICVLNLGKYVGKLLLIYKKKSKLSCLQW